MSQDLDESQVKYGEQNDCLIAKIEIVRYLWQNTNALKL